jgi:mediator of replication checkpoint protein 1
MVEEEEEEKSNDGGFEIDPNAFNVMKKAAKKPTVAYDKKNSKAKNVVDEAAEESEDEYAGLGGASDDSDDEENAYDKQMINDNSGETVDEKELAALNA